MNLRREEPNPIAHVQAPLNFGTLWLQSQISALLLAAISIIGQTKLSD